MVALYDFIFEIKNMTEIELITALAKAYNKLDYTEIEDFVIDNVVYESEQIMAPFFGKQEVFDFIRSQFDTIRNLGVVLSAELATINIEKYSHFFRFDSYSNKPCLILSASDDEKDDKPALVFITTRNGLISNILFRTRIPDFSKAVGTNQFPS